MSYILIVDDHPFVAAATAREAASLTVGAVTHCVDSIASAEETISAGGRPPDFVLLDLFLPDAENLSGLVRLRCAAPNALVAIVSAEASPQVMRDAFAQGARGYLTKARDLDDFRNGLKRFLEDGFFFPPEAAHPVSPAARPEHLTDREVAALNALASGKLNKQLADVVGVAECTFKTHLRTIYKKLGVQTRVAAVSRARQLGVIGASGRA